MSNDSEEEDLQLPEYLSNPVMSKYTGLLFQIVDSLFAETKEPQVQEVEQLKDILMTVYRRIGLDGEIAELDTILRLHYPDFYTAPDQSSIDTLLEYPLSTSN